MRRFLAWLVSLFRSNARKARPRTLDNRMMIDVFKRSEDGDDGR